MNSIVVRRVEVDGGKLLVWTRFRKLEHLMKDFESFRVKRIPSLFDEIAIELSGEKRVFLVPERANGFFELAKELRFEEIFGPLWYRDAEDGRDLIASPATRT